MMKVIKHDKLVWTFSALKTKTLEDSENLLEPEIMAGEIVENLQSALEQFSEIEEALKLKQ